MNIIIVITAHSLNLLIGQNGGLVYASQSVHKIIIATENEIQIKTVGFSKLREKNLDFKIAHMVRRTLAFDHSIFPNLSYDNVEMLEIPHKMKLINAICYRYIKIRLYSYTKFYSQEQLHPIRKRHKLTKLVLFNNE